MNNARVKDLSAIGPEQEDRGACRAGPTLITPLFRRADGSRPCRLPLPALDFANHWAAGRALVERCDGGPR